MDLQLWNPGWCLWSRWPRWCHAFGSGHYTRAGASQHYTDSIILSLLPSHPRSVAAWRLQCGKGVYKVSKERALRICLHWPDIVTLGAVWDLCTHTDQSNNYTKVKTGGPLSLLVILVYVRVIYRIRDDSNVATPGKAHPTMGDSSWKLKPWSFLLHVQATWQARESLPGSLDSSLLPSNGLLLLYPELCKFQVSHNLKVLAFHTGSRKSHALPPSFLEGMFELGTPWALRNAFPGWNIWNWRKLHRRVSLSHFTREA